MKRKICVVLLALSSGLMMVFAVSPDKCTEKFEACKVTCDNLKAQCIARGAEPASCNFRLKQCTADCDKALKACQTKK